MNLAYTMQVTINDEFVLKKGTAADNIPESVTVRRIEFWPTKSSSFPVYSVKGIHEDSGYIQVETEDHVQVIDHVSDEQSIYCYIKTSDSVVFNIKVIGLV